MASVISSFSRAGLNVVDRKQFRQERVCPLAIAYWNNLLPVLLICPLMTFSPVLGGWFSDLLSFEIFLLSLLIQFVAYGFSFAFKNLRVIDIAILTKSADITVPLMLVIAGVYSVSLRFFLLLPLILLIFILSSGIENLKKSYQSSIFLVSTLTAQGVYAYFTVFNATFDREFWGLLSIAFSVLVWRLIFSILFLLGEQRISNVFIFPRQYLSFMGFYLRGILAAVTQVSFVFAITSNNLLIVWPILNATGILAAIFAYLFLREKLSLIDFFFILLASLITCIAVIFLNYQKY